VTSGHILFIPGVALIGMFVGFLLGVRAARNQFELQQRREEERAAARAARARKAEADKPVS
jgi:DNA invertase Pin-like site-specific DNA recombinase